MAITRDNHYVPIWYQRGFLEPLHQKLAYRDLRPPTHPLPNGSVRYGKSRFMSSPKQCFFERDLYTTFFGSVLIDEIEQRLFGKIDAEGAPAIKAFTGTDVAAWRKHFQSLFRFIDAQKLRTPKGLDWLRAQYPSLSQNQLMMEMQEIQAMHCTIWTEGVREIVSAQDAEVKFIVSDHPVTIYNHAAPPEAAGCVYPLDPPIALKASQTIYPLNREFCLILSNLEYAKDPTVAPLEKRTFARNYRNTMVRTDNFIRTRRLSTREVQNINCIIKARAFRFIAGGKEDFLDADREPGESWSALGQVLRPPEKEVWRFGGKLFASFDDGRVHYQDEFGRTEDEAIYLKKRLPVSEPSPRDFCPCGSGLAYRECCKPLPASRRPSWSERGIRERNLMLRNGILKVLALDEGKDWVAVRRDITNEQIKDIYSIYQALWPLETDILRLLPKPDGRPRAVYTGLPHPMAVADFALSTALYFGEVIIENPLLHAGIIRKTFNPINNPESYHQEIIKTVFLFLTLIPLVEAGHINLIPDPCIFDAHLREQMMQMAERRSADLQLTPDADPRIMRLMNLDFKRNIMSMPHERLKTQLRKISPELDEAKLKEILESIRQVRESDPLATIKDGLYEGKDTGQLTLSKLAPNFEMSLYIAQATGASIVTDSPFRWQEILRAVRQQGGDARLDMQAFAQAISRVPWGFPNEVTGFLRAAGTGAFASYPGLIRDVSAYASKIADRGRKPNWEAHAASRFAKIHQEAQKRLRKQASPYSLGTVRGVFPLGGIRDNTVNRLLLMSGSDHHLQSVPAAFFIEPSDQ